jgi:hypothetical protein
LDKLTMLVQQSSVDADRAILFPQSDVIGTFNNILPIQPRARRLLFRLMAMET